MNQMFFHLWSKYLFSLAIHQNVFQLMIKMFFLQSIIWSLDFSADDLNIFQPMIKIFLSQWSIKILYRQDVQFWHFLFNLFWWRKAISLVMLWRGTTGALFIFHSLRSQLFFSHKCKCFLPTDVDVFYPHIKML